MKIKKIIDLTHDLQEDMLRFDMPWHPPFVMQQMGRLDTEGRRTHRISLGTHSGTHMDSPSHFIDGGGSIENISLDKLIGEITIVDFSDLSPNQAVTKKMLYGIVLTKRMLFKFGWGKYWGNQEQFYNNYPFFSREAAEYLVSKNVLLIAMDTPSPDDSRIKLGKATLGGEDDSPIHKIFLKNNIVLIEYVANLDKIEDYEGWNIIAMPLRIKGADGSPVRVCIFR